MVVTKKGYKFMRIFSMIISVIAFVASISGCSSYPHQNWLEDDSLDKVAEERFDGIISALENKDKEAIKSMFSKQALEEIENLDESIAYIMNCYKGELKSVDKSLATDENLNGKNRKVTIKADYTVITDVETYNLFFIEISNTESPDENGLYMIWLSKESEKEKYQGNYGAGIYFPED